MSQSGLYSTFGYAPESTWSTFATPTHFITYNSETMAAKKTVLQAQALAGNIYLLSQRRSVGKWGAGGQVSLNIYDSKLGLLFKNMLGAGTSSVLTGSVYQQVFTPSDTTGESLTVQVGRPTTGSGIQAVTYEGAKVTDWSISVKAGELVDFSCTFDAYKEDMSQTYATPSYTSSNILVAASATLYLGGTPSTTSGVTTISGGSAVPLVRECEIKGTNVIDADRYMLGSIYKKEQLINGFRKIEGSMTLDWNALTSTYNTFAADGNVALQIQMLGPIISGTTNSMLNILVPCLYFDQDEFPVGGPQIIPEKVTFQGLYDGTDNAIQFVYDTLDSTI